MTKQNKPQSAEPGSNNRFTRGQPWKLLLCFIGVALLLNVALAAVALNYLVPKVVERKEGLAARLDWYIHHGQLQADARTLAAACEYLTGTDRDVPASATNLAVLPVAGDAAPNAPKS